MFPADHLDVEGRIHAADKAMYEAEYADGTAIQLYSQVESRLLDV